MIIEWSPVITEGQTASLGKGEPWLAQRGGFVHPAVLDGVPQQQLHRWVHRALGQNRDPDCTNDLAQDKSSAPFYTILLGVRPSTPTSPILSGSYTPPLDPLNETVVNEHPTDLQVN